MNTTHLLPGESGSSVTIGQVCLDSSSGGYSVLPASATLDLRLEISEEGADAERLAALTGYLRAELIQLDVEDVTAPQGGEVPPGARVVGVAAVGALLVGLGQSADGLRAVVSAIRAWLQRGDGIRRTVRLELDGNALELSQASAADQERLIELFVSRHATEESRPWPASGKR